MTSLEDSACRALGYLFHSTKASGNLVERLTSLLSPYLAGAGSMGQPPSRSDQGILILLATTLSGDSDVGTFQQLCKALKGISVGTLPAWVALFDSGFVKVLFMEMIKAEIAMIGYPADGKNQQQQQLKVVVILTELLGQLVAQVDASSSYEISGVEWHGCVRVLFEIIAESPPTLRTAHSKTVSRVLVASIATVRFIMGEEDPRRSVTRLELVSSACRACSTVIGQLSSLDKDGDVAACVQQLFDAALSILSGKSWHLSLRRDAVVLLANCASLDQETHFETCLQLGSRFVNSELNSLKQVVAPSASLSPPPRSTDDHLAEMSAAVSVLRSLLGCTAESEVHRKALTERFAHPLAHACLFAHLNGDYFVAASGDEDMADEPCQELTAFTDLTLYILNQELKTLSFASTQSKWIIITALEYCTELLNEHAIVVASNSALASGSVDSAANRGCLARLLSFIGLAIASFALPELCSTTYHCLVELLSHNSAGSFVGIISREIVSLAAKNADASKCMDLTEEVLCSMFARTLGANRVQHHNAANASTMQISEMALSVLAGVARGLDSVASFYLNSSNSNSRAENPDRLLRFRGKLSLMFERLTLDIYASPGSIVASRAGIGLGFLLTPIATCFSSLIVLQLDDTSSADNTSNTLVQSLRGFWYSMVLFRLCERDSWSDHPEWLQAYQTIAAHSPAIVLGSDNSSAQDLLEKELSCSPFLQALVNGVQDNSYFSKVLPKVAQFKVSGLNFPQLMYGVTVQFLESLRVGGTLDVRPMMTYLDDDAVGSNEWMKNTLNALSDQVFTVWLESAGEQLRGTVDSSAPSWRIRSVVGQVFEFLVGHCAHHRNEVRNMANRFAKRILEHIAWLMWSPTAVFVLLDTIQTLSLRARHLTQQHSQVDWTQGTAVATSGSAASSGIMRTIDPNESDAARISNALLPPSLLPHSSIANEDATRRILHLAYDWFSAAASNMPAELESVIQEYLLLDRVKGVSSHAGVSLAKALTSSSPLALHSLSPPMSASLCVPSGTSSSYSSLSSSSSSSSMNLSSQALVNSLMLGFDDAGGGGGGGEKFTTELQLKSRYMGEILGMLQTEQRESPACATSSFISLCKQLYANLTDKLSKNDYLLVVDSIWLCMTLVHNVSLHLLQSTSCLIPMHELRVLWEWVHRLLHLTSSCAVCCHNKQIVEALVLTWRWLFLSYPRLRNRIVFESMSALFWTCQRRVGMFASEAKVEDEICDSHLLWITFLDKTITSFGDCEGVGFFFIESILFSSSPMGSGWKMKSTLPSTTILPRFMLLKLGFKCIRAALGSANGPSLERRRALRERIIKNALEWFDVSPEVLTPLYPPIVKEGHAVMRSFIKDLQEDAFLWSEEYHSKSGENASVWPSTQSRSAGTEPAIAFLNQLALDADVAANVCSLSRPELQFESTTHQSSQRSLGISRDAQGHCHSGILSLLRMFLLHEIDRYASWGMVSNKSEQDIFELKKSRDDLASITNIANYKVAIKAAWCFSPSLAFAIATRFPTLEGRDGMKKGLSHLKLFQVLSPRIVQNNWTATALLVSCAKRLPAEDASESSRLFTALGIGTKLSGLKSLGFDIAQLKLHCLRKTIFGFEAPLHVALDLLTRPVESAKSLKQNSFAEAQHLCTEVVRYATRCIKATSLNTLLLPQLVQLLRRDEFGVLRDVLLELCLKSPHVCHMAVWYLISEEFDGGHGREFHGFCNSLQGEDALPARASALIDQIRATLSPSALQFLDQEVDFFSRLTNISATLQHQNDKSKRSQLIVDELGSVDFRIEGGIYLPTDQTQKVIGIEMSSGSPMRSAAKCPYLLSFKTEAWAGLDEFIISGSDCATAAKVDLPGERKVPVQSRKFTSPDAKKRSNPRRLSLIWPPPPPSPVKDLSMQTVDSSTTVDGVGSSETAISSTTTHSCIFKVYDDCRQDILTIQVVRIIRDEFQRIGLPLVLTPYGIVPTRTGKDMAVGGIIEVLPHVKSRDEIGQCGDGKRLIDFYVNRFGPQSSSAFKQAQIAFASSLAGYAVVCHLLAIKDRHNGNWLIDEEGHVIHIDYGFLLGISPGRNMNFESAGFKFSGEMVELLGGESSDLYSTFVVS